MASGSQTKSGICADLPVAPMNSSSVMTEIVPNAVSGASGASERPISWKSSVPKRTKMSSTPSTNPTSPMRLTMNAFLPASVADFF